MSQNLFSQVEFANMTQTAAIDCRSPADNPVTLARTKAAATERECHVATAPTITECVTAKHTDILLLRGCLLLLNRLLLFAGARTITEVIYFRLSPTASDHF